MTKKIFRSILTVGVAVLACSLLLVMGCFYSFYEGMQEHQLGDELRIAAAAVETNGSTYLEKIKSDRFRVTWIASDGTVLYDTQADAAQMENHLEREEVREALETGTGSSSRYSATLLQKTVYSASRLTDGTVLRLSASRATMGALLLGAFQPILLVVIVLLVLSSLLASRLAKRIVEPLNASTSSIRWKTTPMRSSLRSCAASTASADRSMPSSPSCGRKQTNSHRSPPA